MNSPEESPKTTDSPSSPSVFKVGDKVLIVGKVYETTTGKEGVVTRVFLHGSVWVTVAGNEFSYNPPDLRHADYKPAVGDVVEFERGNKKCKGIIYRYYPEGFHIRMSLPDGGSYGMGALPSDLFKKIDHVDFVPDEATCCANLDKDAKAYFSEQSFTPTGTYAERQKQWVEHYEIKVGSKVKVVRDSDGEKDWADTGLNLNGVIGTCYTVSSIDHYGIGVKGHNYYLPYSSLEPVK